MGGWLMGDALARDAILGVSLNYRLPMASLITVKLILIALFDAYKSETNENSVGHVGSRMLRPGKRYARYGHRYAGDIWAYIQTSIGTGHCPLVQCQRQTRNETFCAISL